MAIPYVRQIRLDIDSSKQKISETNLVLQTESKGTDLLEFKIFFDKKEINYADYNQAIVVFANSQKVVKVDDVTAVLDVSNKKVSWIIPENFYMKGYILGQLMLKSTLATTLSVKFSLIVEPSLLDNATIDENEIQSILDKIQETIDKLEAAESLLDENIFVNFDNHRKNTNPAEQHLKNIGTEISPDYVLPNNQKMLYEGLNGGSQGYLISTAQNPPLFYYNKGETVENISSALIGANPILTSLGITETQGTLVTYCPQESVAKNQEIKQTYLIKNIVLFRYSTDGTTWAEWENKTYDDLKTLKENQIAEGTSGILNEYSIQNYLFLSGYFGLDSTSRNDLNNYTKTGKTFIYNASNSPESYGFLDISYCNGKGFSPSQNNGGNAIQKFIGWDTGKTYTRYCTNISTKNWSAWALEGNYQKPLEKLTWIEPQYLNGATGITDKLATCKYTKTKENIVIVSGFLSVTTLPGDIFALPTGFRPSNSIAFNSRVQTDNTIVDARILTSGRCCIFNARPNNTMQIHVVFVAEQ